MGGSRDSLTLIIQVNHFETSDPATPRGNCNIRKTELDALYEIKVPKSFLRDGRRGWMPSLGHVRLQCLSKVGSSGRKEGP